MTRLALAPISRSVTGRRTNNEDAVFASERLAAVADGVGGAAGGEVASRLVIDALAHLDKSRLTEPLPLALDRAVAEGNAAVAFVAAETPSLAGMGTTLTTIALDDDGSYRIANVGDSRAYLHRAGELRRLTRDDSLVQALVDGGVVSEDEAMGHPQRSVVLDALDGRAREATTIVSVPAAAGDRLLLCSDGLSDVLPDPEIASLLEEPTREACADRLVAAALAAGARDNVSVLVADVLPAGTSEPLWPGVLASSSPPEGPR